VWRVDSHLYHPSSEFIKGSQPHTTLVYKMLFLEKYVIREKETRNQSERNQYSIQYIFWKEQSFGYIK
jgi:hypothetical protein